MGLFHKKRDIFNNDYTMNKLNNVSNDKKFSLFKKKEKDNGNIFDNQYVNEIETEMPER